jgi:hypothetical protein
MSGPNLLSLHTVSIDDNEGKKRLIQFVHLDNGQIWQRKSTQDNLGRWEEQWENITLHSGYEEGYRPPWQCVL